MTMSAEIEALLDEIIVELDAIIAANEEVLRELDQEELINELNLAEAELKL